MIKIFTSFDSRKNADLIGFSAIDNAALMAVICLNSATSYVRAGFNCVLVPKHKAADVAEHLVNQGWSRA